MGKHGYIEFPILDQIYTFDIYSLGSNFPHVPGIYMIARLKDIHNPSAINLENILYLNQSDDLEQSIMNAPDWRKLHEDGADTVLFFPTESDEQRRIVYQHVKNACTNAGS